MDPTAAARALHDLGLAAWFGCSLSRQLAERNGGVERRFSGAEQAVLVGAMAAHALGAAELAWANRARLAAQQGVATLAGLKALLTVAAAVATWRSAELSRGVVWDAGADPADSGAEQSLRAAVGWSVPALTGALLVVSALMGEQQRPKYVFRGVLARGGRIAASRAAAAL